MRGAGLVLWLCGGSAWAFCGCATVGTPAAVAFVTGTRFAYHDGWGQQAFAMPAEEVREAAIIASEDLKMSAIHKERAGEAWILDARSHDGRHVRVSIQPTPSGCVASTRIGRFGDEALARSLTERIGVRLGTLPSSPPPDEPPASTHHGWFSRDAVPDAVMLSDQIGSQYHDSGSP